MNKKGGNVKGTKRPKYTKVMAARQLGISGYKLGRMISAGVLPNNPTREQVEEFHRKNVKAKETYRKAVITAFDEKHSMEFLTKMIDSAVASFELILPKGTSSSDFVWRVLYDHSMEEKHERIKKS